jgi:hypothetical protein
MSNTPNVTEIQNPSRSRYMGPECMISGNKNRGSGDTCSHAVYDTSTVGESEMPGPRVLLLNTARVMKQSRWDIRISPMSLYIT